MNLIGIVAAVGCIIATMLIEGTHPGALVNLPAFLIVVGTSFSAGLVQFAPKDIGSALKHFGWLIAPPHVNLEAQAEFLAGMSATARQQGILSLENSVGSAPDDFTRNGIQMIVDGVDKESLAKLLDNAIQVEQEKLEPNAKFYEAVGGYAPTFGIIGAVLGLIHAMGLLDRPDLLGPSIAVAFVATIYGLVLANIVCLPAANRIKSLNSEIAMYKYMTLEGLVSIASSENTMMLKRRVSAFTGTFSD